MEPVTQHPDAHATEDNGNRVVDVEQAILLRKLGAQDAVDATCSARRD